MSAAVIERYVLVGRDGVERDYEYTDLDEAKKDAGQQDCAVIARQYQYWDSELVWTPKGEDTWK